MEAIIKCKALEFELLHGKSIKSNLQTTLKATDAMRNWTLEVFDSMRKWEPRLSFSLPTDENHIFTPIFQIS